MNRISSNSILTAPRLPCCLPAIEANDSGVADTRSERATRPCSADEFQPHPPGHPPDAPSPSPRPQPTQHQTSSRTEPSRSRPGPKGCTTAAQPARVQGEPCRRRPNRGRGGFVTGGARGDHVGPTPAAALARAACADVPAGSKRTRPGPCVHRPGPRARHDDAGRDGSGGAGGAGRRALMKSDAGPGSGGED